MGNNKILIETIIVISVTIILTKIFSKYESIIIVVMPMAIIFTSILFAYMHISKGSFSIVAIDLSGIFIDSIFYGIIFSNTNNIFAAWIPHFTSDLRSLILKFTSISAILFS